MSRSTVAKSRAEKGKSTSAPTPAVTHEIVPGKFNDQDWNQMLDHDDGDDFVMDLVGEMCNSALDIIYENYLQKQLVPFTVMLAKDALLQIIEWQYLSRDEGENKPEADPAWTQDEEPEPAVTDCWAQGSVPRMVIKTPRDTIPEENEEEQEDEQEEEPEAPEVMIQEPEVEMVEEPEVDAVPTKEVHITEDAITIPEPPTKKDDKSKVKRRKFKPYRGKLKSAGVSQMTTSLEKSEMQMFFEELPDRPVGSPDTVMLQMPSSCFSMLKLQAGRPPVNRDAEFDESGNIVTVPRLNPSRLPSHRVKTGFQVVDPKVEAAQARLEAMRTGRYLSKQRKQTKEPAPRTIVMPTRMTKGSSLTPGSPVKDAVTPLPPPLLETMEVSPGVTIREGDRIKKGPKHHPKKADIIAMATNRALKPVSVRPARPTYMVHELLDKDPLIRPLRETPPIPPIMPHPPAQSVGGL